MTSVSGFSSREPPLRCNAFASIVFLLLGRKGRISADWRGQATVEGAFLIPVIFLMLMLLIQPGILLYDRVVMQSAASEGCRLIATRIPGDSSGAYEGYVLRRLGSIPQQENFHVHEEGCSWEVMLEGDEGSELVSVRIRNQVAPLPFFDFGARAMGLVNESGNYVQEVNSSMHSKSPWVVANKKGMDPDAWVQGNGSTAERGEG